MVPTIRSAPAANTLPEPMTNGNDSDLDEYQQRDNLESYRASEFQPPLSDNDVLIAESLVSAPAGDQQHSFSPLATRFGTPLS